MPVDAVAGQGLALVDEQALQVAHGLAAGAQGEGRGLLRLTDGGDGVVGPGVVVQLGQHHAGLVAAGVDHAAVAKVQAHVLHLVPVLAEQQAQHALGHVAELALDVVGAGAPLAGGAAGEHQAPGLQGAAGELGAVKGAAAIVPAAGAGGEVAPQDGAVLGDGALHMRVLLDAVAAQLRGAQAPGGAVDVGAADLVERPAPDGFDPVQMIFLDGHVSLSSPIRSLRMSRSGGEAPGPAPGRAWRGGGRGSCAPGP